MRYLKVRGAARRVPTTVEDMEDIGPRGDREDALLGACSNSNINHIRAAEQDGKTSRRSKRASQALRRGEWAADRKTLQEKIEYVMITSPVCPMVGGR